MTIREAVKILSTSAAQADCRTCGGTGLRHVDNCSACIGTGRVLVDRFGQPLPWPRA